MIEKNQTECKNCGQLKLRIQDGTFDGRNKRWRDATGRLWNGKVCGMCNVSRAKVTMQKARKNAK